MNERQYEINILKGCMNINRKAKVTAQILFKLMPRYFGSIFAPWSSHAISKAAYSFDNCHRAPNKLKRIECATKWGMKKDISRGERCKDYIYISTKNNPSMIKRKEKESMARNENKYVFPFCRSGKRKYINKKSTRKKNN